MKKGISALEKSQNVDTAAGNSRHIVFVILGAVAAIGIVASGYQLFAQRLYESGVAQNRAAAEQAAGQIQTILARQANITSEHASDPSLAAALEAGGTAIEQAQQRLVGSSEVVRALLLDPRVELITPEPYPGPSFSAIAVALLAKEQGSVSGPVIAGQGEQGRVNWAAPVRADGELVGELVATFPIDPLVTTLGRPSGYLDLRVPRATGRPDVVAYRGTTTDARIDTLDAVPAGDRLAVGYAYDAPFGLVIPSLPGAIGLLLLSVALGVAGFWIRYQPDLGFLRREEEEEEDAEILPDAELVDSELAEAMQFTEAAGRRTTGKTRQRPEADPVIFRTYDIRGIVNKQLDGNISRQIGHAIGSEAVNREVAEVVVARDGRISGPELSDALIEGLCDAGVNVVDIGMVPTGVLYFATHHLDTGSGVMVTGSHNPADYNGFKVMLAGETLSGEAIKDLYRRIAEDDMEYGSGGVQEMDIVDEYVERIASDIQVEEPLKVVIDCGNGIPGIVAPQVLEEIGCEVIPLYCEVDGTFPNHHPDPSVPENLADLITSVNRLEADIGIALDGDGDRLGMVTPDGRIVYPDRLLMLFAEDVLLRNPGATIIYDVKCTGHLAKVILRHGGSPLMWKTGHSLIKAKMKETDAALAGEMSGHFFFKERWYGFDDGIYAAARLLEILAASPDGVQAALDQLPDSVSTPEIKIQMEEGAHFEFVEKFQQNVDFEGARVTTIDGVRADYDDGWGLVRCSNTTPCLVLRFDAETGEALKRIQAEFKQRMLAVDKSLKIPF